MGDKNMRHRVISVKEAGKRGGETTLERHGADFFRRIGKKGGKHNSQLYRELLCERGKLGGRPKRAAINEGRGEEAGKKRR
jgi:uncharacterized protein